MEPALCPFRLMAELALSFMEMKHSCCSSNLVPSYGFVFYHKIQDRNRRTHRKRFKAPAGEQKQD